jgi:hypothetical protein
MKELIEDIKNKKPIKVYILGNDYGVYEYNEVKQRYEGFGYLTMESIKKILKKEVDFIEIRRAKNE